MIVDYLTFAFSEPSLFNPVEVFVFNCSALEASMITLAYGRLSQ